MKDPAFLFYSQDFIVGTLAMPFDERGKYITLLCYQHQTGRMSEETIRLLVGSVSDMLRLKFQQDENGLFFNERLEIEIGKRDKFTQSRVNNGKLGGRPIKKNNLNKTDRLSVAKAKNNLIENENENENEVKILDKYMVCFENFRKEYKGKKNGFEIEYQNFIKKNNPNIIELLLPALLDEIEYRQRSELAGAFVAEWKNLSTWINQKCWLQELPEIKINQNGKVKSVSSRSAEIDAIVNAVYDAKGMQ
jgi:hypothetical protein